jgi:hypothetical protein
MTVVALVAAARVDAAAGGIAHPSLWPGPLDSLEGFDRASRAVLHTRIICAELTRSGRKI